MRAGQHSYIGRFVGRSTLYGVIREFTYIPVTGSMERQDRRGGGRAWCSRVDAEVRLQTGVLMYTVGAGAAGLTLEQFGLLFREVFQQVGAHRGPGKAEQEEDPSGGAWMARCVGEAPDADGKGCPRWLCFEVLVRFPRRIRMENTLSRLRLDGVGSSGWKAAVHDKSPHGLGWRVWLRILLERWAAESVDGVHPIGRGFEDLGVLDGLFYGCRQCAWMADGATVRRVRGQCGLWCLNNTCVDARHGSFRPALGSGSV
jgi:hypothetical protein